MSTAPQPPQHPLFHDWVDFFNEGREFAVVVDKERLVKKLRGNTAVLAAIALTLAVSLGLGALLLFTDIGRVATYVLVALFIVVTVLLLFFLLGLRRKLRAAGASDTYFRLSRRGMIVAETLEIPWELTTGVAVVDTRGQRAVGLVQKLGHKAASAAGAEQVVVCIGFNADVTKPLRSGAHPALRRLFLTTFEFGMFRLALDPAVPAEQLTRSIYAIPAAAKSGGRDVVITESKGLYTTALVRLSNGKSPFEELLTFADPDERGDDATGTGSNEAARQRPKP
ncbi:hypothetical protein [uncultured Agrococcus sp.]|uniref:hypothetical protein n=1 Tax=uncultured Agrococcus sp. TaxID=382258 RepID=UPI0025DB0058|nr:hypothetical protein [uncultured Agrococcus sp.]